MNRILLLIFILLMVGCWSDNLTKEEKMAKKANREIENNIEKIFLLSQIEKIEYHTAKEILESYFIVTFDQNSELESKEDYDDLIKRGKSKVS